MRGVHGLYEQLSEILTKRPRVAWGAGGGGGGAAKEKAVTKKPINILDPKNERVTIWSKTMKMRLGNISIL
jgi:hypothetical protein